MRPGIASLAVVALALGACGEPSVYPAKDITIVIPFNSGGGFDTYVRALAPSLEAQFPGEINVLPKNLPGAGGRRGASDVYRARPDGYTIGVFNMPGVLIPGLQGIATEYDLSRMTWLATLGYDPYVFAVKGNSPLNSIDDLRSLRQDPGRSEYGGRQQQKTQHIQISLIVFPQPSFPAGIMYAAARLQWGRTKSERKTRHHDHRRRDP